MNSPSVGIWEKAGATFYAAALGATIRIWGGAMTTPFDFSTPILNTGAGSLSRDCRNIDQYFSGARRRSWKGRWL